MLDVVEDGAVRDHLVVMRRMPDELCLATLVSRGAAVDAHLRAIARAVAAFHARAATSDEIATAATADAVRANWVANIAGAERFTGGLLDADLERRIERRALRYLDGRAPLFERRIAEGRVRDGHGDLLAADIFCLPDGPRILDCIEFDDRLRHGDVLADVAFLAMDLERLGRPDLARRFLTHYREFSAETHPASLAHHYIAYRAHVRAKVACLRHEQGDAAAAAEASRLLRIAFTHAERARVTLTLVGGLPGTGKSTLGARLSEALGSVHLRSDVVRRELRGLPATGSPAGFAEGMYAPAVTARTYRELLRRAERLLRLGESVVLDATWTDPRWRARAARIATSTSSDLVQLECRAPLEVAEGRIEARRTKARDVSEATADVARTMASRCRRWPSAVAVDTTRDRSEELVTALRAVARSAPEHAGAAG